MSTVVDWANVILQYRRQGNKFTPQQEKAFFAASKAMREGGDLRAVMTAFTSEWRFLPPVEQPAPASPKEERQRIFNSFAGIPNLSQPDEVTCQAATCAMLAGKAAADIPVIRRTLQSFGNPGAPRVMARYLRSQLGERYILEEDATLRQAIEWLKAGEAIGTHGWHTRPGHVCLLDGVRLNNNGEPTDISVKDPSGKFDGQTWSFVKNTRFYDGDLSLLLCYALFVVNSGGMSGSRQAYRKGSVNLDQGGMICHRVLPPSAAVSSAPLLKINQAGIDLIQKWEGLYLKSYLCPSNIWTIGYGSTIWFDNKPVRPGMTCTREQAEQLFRRDIARAESDVRALVTVPLNSNQFSALVSFAQNCGSDRDDDTIPEGLGDSTLLRLLNQGNYAGAQKEFSKWVKGEGGVVLAGLVSRRKEEAELFGRKP